MTKMVESRHIYWQEQSLMKAKILWWILGGLGILFLLSSLTITFVEYNRYKSRASVFPPGSMIAGIPVDGLDAAAAEARLTEFYELPLDIEIEGTIIEAAPVDLGFTFDPTSLVQIGLDQIGKSGFWGSLWNRPQSPPVTVPLEASVDQAKLRAYLNQEIAPRYAQPGSPLTPIPFTTNFALSSNGNRLDVDQAAVDITAALQAPETHQVTLRVTADAGSEFGWSSLEAFLKHNINFTKFDGLVEVYLESMEDGKSLHFAVWNSETVTPDIAFTGFSAIKIPIMISLMRRLEEPIPDVVIGLMEEMIVNSENAAADTLMEYYIDETRGPLVVTEDMELLGLKNTFLAGFFYPGAPILQLFETPANSRTDIYLDPDYYNQIDIAEIGLLLDGIYQCAVDGTGLIMDTFSDDITQSECQTIIDIFALPKPLQFIDTTLTPDSVVADKYGYGLDVDNLVHTITDNAIVFTPGGDFVLDIAVYHPDWLYVYDGQIVIGRLAQTVYNFFNPNNQAYWWFD
jgi:beta-lactamase class A